MFSGNRSVHLGVRREVECVRCVLTASVVERDDNDVCVQRVTGDMPSYKTIAKNCGVRSLNVCSRAASSS
jgi:hypothetical protein